MTYVLVNHEVEDYDKWKTIYDDTNHLLKAHGARVSSVFRSADDPNQVLVLTQFESLESAENFAKSHELRTAMQKAGVKGKLEINFLEETEKITF